MIASLRKRKLILFKQEDLPAPGTESRGSGFLCLWHPQLCHEQLPSWEQYRLCHCKHLIQTWQFPEEDRDLLLLDLPLKNEASTADTGLCHLNTSFGDGDFTSQSLELMIAHCWVSPQELNSSKQGFLHKSSFPGIWTPRHLVTSASLSSPLDRLTSCCDQVEFNFPLCSMLFPSLLYRLCSCGHSLINLLSLKLCYWIFLPKISLQESTHEEWSQEADLTWYFG